MENKKEMRKWLDDMNLGHPLVVAVAAIICASISKRANKS